MPVSDKIVLIEDGSIISKDEDIANIFNSYFVNITDTLPIEKPMLPSDCRINDPVLHAIEIEQFKSDPIKFVIFVHYFLSKFCLCIAYFTPWEHLS